MEIILKLLKLAGIIKKLIGGLDVSSGEDAIKRVSVILNKALAKHNKELVKAEDLIKEAEAIRKEAFDKIAKGRELIEKIKNI